MVEPLPNPERSWERPAATTFDRGEVESRLGPTTEPLELLAGGLANTHIRVGRDRVLRIYRGDLAVKATEAALLRRRWASFVVPEVLAEGPDFLVLEHVAHVPLEAAHGAAIGRALAEVHATRFPRAGLLDERLAVARPFADWLSDFVDHARPRHAGAASFLERRERLLREAAGPPVLLHGDWKLSNLSWAGCAPLVLDWEFAYAGPALLDVGQLLRWNPPERFAGDFEAAHREAGGELPDDWRRLAAAFDLVNLAGLLDGAGEGSIRRRDVLARIERTLADFDRHR